MMPKEARLAAIRRVSATVMERGEEIADVIPAENGSPTKWSFAGTFTTPTDTSRRTRRRHIQRNITQREHVLDDE